MLFRSVDRERPPLAADEPGLELEPADRAPAREAAFAEPVGKQAEFAIEALLEVLEIRWKEAVAGDFLTHRTPMVLCGVPVRCVPRFDTRDSDYALRFSAEPAGVGRGGEVWWRF